MSVGGQSSPSAILSASKNLRSIYSSYLSLLGGEGKAEIYTQIFAQQYFSPDLSIANH